MIRVTTSQQGNHVNVRWKGHDAAGVLEYFVDGIALPPLQDFTFALWHLLPYAMRNGEDVYIEGSVDATAIRNAQAFVDVWEMWEPHRFRPIGIGAEVQSETVDAKKLASPGPLTLFSGGVDSTAMILRLGHRSPRAYALTVHGMDYDYENADGFASLLRRTDSFLDEYGYDRITLRSSAARTTAGFFSYGLALAGYAFLLSNLFESAQIAADYSREQDFMIHPRGLNPTLSRFYRGSAFHLSSVFTDTTRAQKIRRITAHPAALRVLSVCKRRDVRPLNCGQCQKCLRTKLAFAATTGTIPPVFIDPQFGTREIAAIDLSSPIERVFFIDAYQEARKLSLLKGLPDLEARFERDIRTRNENVRARRSNSRSPARKLAGRLARRMLGQRAWEKIRSMVTHR